jgi:NADPH:quinone reductase-like Zn-dependent oxidoreductase
MKAMMIKEFGGPEVFEPAEAGQPPIRPNDVLVKVHATSINPVDYKVRENGRWAGIEPPAIIGYDVSGVIVDVGDAVRDLKVGDEVFYTPMVRGGEPGSYAEYHAAPQSIVALKPVNLTHTQAASLPLAGCTAWDALILKTQVRVGESVLIHGGGGVGSLAIQIAKAAGAYVIAVVSDYMVDLAEDLGADRAIDYKSEDFVEIVQEETDGLGVDVVFDTIGGDAMTRSIEVTKPLGRIAGIVSTDTGFRRAFIKNINVYPTWLQRDRFKLDALRDLVERGQLRPVIDSVVPLIEVAEAHRRLEKGGVKGKIVLSVSEPEPKK